MYVTHNIVATGSNGGVELIPIFYQSNFRLANVAKVIVTLSTFPRQKSEKIISSKLVLTPPEFCTITIVVNLIADSAVYSNSPMMIQHS